MHRRSLLAWLAALPAAALPAPVAWAQESSASQGPLTVFAAASLTEALRALGKQWAAKGHPEPRFSFAASSALARQIEQGAGADLFLSADEPWMDHLQERGLIREDTRVSPIGNALVLITPADRPRTIAPVQGSNLPAALGPRGRLALGDPAHVPAGRYAQAALTSLGQWEALAPRLARADNVRSALLLVERGEAPLGIVYATDAAASSGVAVAGTFPPESHRPITYPFAVTQRAAGKPAAAAFHAFIAGPEAEATWRRFGFTTRR